MSELWSCPGEASCRILGDDVTAVDVTRTLASMPWRWRWLTLGLPPEAVDLVAPYVAAVDGATTEREAWHAAEHAHSAAGRAIAAAGFIRPQTGTVTGLFAGKGLPKPPLESAQVWRRGLVGDVQRERKHHGRPSQALCLWSADVVDALVAEGHPIAPGHAGENVAIRGVDWAAVRPGALVRIGDVECELSGWALPCAKNRRWFVKGVGEKRIDPDRHPGWSRAYAYVLTSQSTGVDGEIHIGDEAAFS